jgi:hypothetical protein
MSDERTSGGVSEARRAELLERLRICEQAWDTVPFGVSHDCDLYGGTYEELRALLSSAPVEASGSHRLVVRLRDASDLLALAADYCQGFLWNGFDSERALFIVQKVTSLLAGQRATVEAPQRRPAPAPASDEEIDAAFHGGADPSERKGWRACERYYGHGIAAASETQEKA